MDTDQMRKRAKVLYHGKGDDMVAMADEIDRLRGLADVARESDAVVQLLMLKLHAITEVVHGRPISEFEDSFQVVRQVVDLAHHNHHLDMLRKEAERGRDAARGLACEILTACTEKQPASIIDEIDSWGEGPWQDPSTMGRTQSGVAEPSAAVDLPRRPPGPAEAPAQGSNAQVRKPRVERLSPREAHASARLVAAVNIVEDAVNRLRERDHLADSLGADVLELALGALRNPTDDAVLYHRAAERLDTWTSVATWKGPPNATPADGTAAADEEQAEDQRPAPDMELYRRRERNLKSVLRQLAAAMATDRRYGKTFECAAADLRPGDLYRRGDGPYNLVLAVGPTFPPDPERDDGFDRPFHLERLGLDTRPGQTSEGSACNEPNARYTVRRLLYCTPASWTCPTCLTPNSGGGAYPGDKLEAPRQCDGCGTTVRFERAYYSEPGRDDEPSQGEEEA